MCLLFGVSAPPSFLEISREQGKSSQQGLLDLGCTLAEFFIIVYATLAGSHQLKCGASRKRRDIRGYTVVNYESIEYTQFDQVGGKHFRFGTYGVLYSPKLAFLG